MELWDLYDCNKRRTGKDIQRGMVIPQGFYHLCVEVWVINRKKEVLLTQRHPDKASCPLYWECSGGAAKKGETGIDAAMREIQEETGLTVQEDDMILINESGGCNWFMDSYLYVMKGDPYPELKLQEDEVVAAKWVPVDKLKDEKNVIDGKVKRFLGNFSRVESICGL